MIAKGQKRKSRDEEDAAGWESQRQSVLDISVVKYQHCLEQAEPSLRRSVLIANTLREITMATEPPAEVVREAVSAPPRVSPPSRIPAGHCPASLADRPTDVAHCRANVEDTEEDWVGMTVEPDFSVSTAISSILTELDATIDGGPGPEAAPRPPLRSLENLPGSGHDGGGGGGGWLADGHKAKGGKPWESMTWGSVEVTEVMASGYLQDVTLDDLFQDIDTSALERDTGELGVRALSSSSFSPTSSCPFSQELLRYLPSLASSTSPSSPFFSSSSFSSSPLSSLQGHRELTELDHFMEILVES